jgi:hypothetical protein
MAFLAFGAPGGGLFGIASEAAVVHNSDAWKKGGKRARRSGLGRAAFAADQHAADARINGIQYQGASHALLSNDGCKWVDGWHRCLRR